MTIIFLVFRMRFRLFWDTPPTPQHMEFSMFYVFLLKASLSVSLVWIHRWMDGQTFAILESLLRLKILPSLVCSCPDFYSSSYSDFESSSYSDFESSSYLDLHPTLYWDSDCWFILIFPPLFPTLAKFVIRRKSS